MNYLYFINPGTNEIYRWNKITLDVWSNQKQEWVEMPYEQNNSMAANYLIVCRSFLSNMTEISREDAILELL